MMAASQDAQMDESSVVPEADSSASAGMNVDSCIPPVGEEDTLRDVGWWTSAPDSLLAEFVPTLPEVPASLRTAVGDAREEVARRLLMARGTSDESAYWRLFFAFDRLLFGNLRDRQDGDHQPVKIRVRERLDLFWGGHWAVLAAESQNLPHDDAARAIGDATTAQRIRTLMEKGEISRAMSAVRATGRMCTAQQTSSAFRAQQPRSQSSSAPAPVDGTLREGIRQALSQSLGGQWLRTPSGSGAGPTGERYEHWRAMSSEDSSGVHVARVLAALAVGDAPAEAMQLFLRCRLAGIPKKGGMATRILACGGVARRLVARTLCHLFREQISAAAGPQQFGVGIKAGTEQLHKVLSAHAVRHSDHCFVSLDVSNAFPSLDRREAASRIDAACPALSQVYRAWYQAPVWHAVSSGRGGPSALIQQRCGVDQGCPLSPAFFAAALALARTAAQQRSRAKAARPDIFIYAYLDDMYVVAPSEALRDTLDIIAEELRNLGLHVHEGKYKSWCPSGNDKLPMFAGSWASASLPCLGSVITWARPDQEAEEMEWRDTDIGLSSDMGVADSCAQLAAFTTLSLQLRLILLRTFVNGAVTHRQRACRSSGEDWNAFDTQAATEVSKWLGGALPESAHVLLFMPLKRGGVGFQSAVARADAAFLASWEGSAARLAADAGLPSVEVFRATYPSLAAPVAAAETFLWSRRAPVIARTYAPGAKGRQKQLTQPVVEAAIREMFAKLPTGLRAIVDSGGTSQGCAWLLVPRNRDHRLTDPEMAVLLRRRLLFPDPTGRGSAPCHHRAVGQSRKICTVVPGDADHGVHAMSCNVGPGWLTRHTNICKAWRSLLRDRLGEWAVLEEQYIEAWNKAKPDGSIEHAKLDLVIQVPWRGRLTLDISVTEAATATNLRGARHTPRPGAAAKKREREKHTRYPPQASTPEFIPIVYESGGRPGREAEAFLRAIVAYDDDRASALQDLRQRLAVALQRGNAALLLSAGQPPGGWPWAVHGG